ncbi:MAG: DUF721 domain-containing protein [Brevinematia bacterium]
MGRIRSISIGIKNYFNTCLDKNQLIVTDLRRNWEKIVGKANAFHSIPSRLLNRKLFIDVNDNIWIQEFSLRADEILKLINEHLKKNIVEKLHFRFKYFERPGVATKKEEVKDDFSISEEKLKKIEEVVSKIEDKKLREALKHYLIMTCSK